MHALQIGLFSLLACAVAGCSGDDSGAQDGAAPQPFGSPSNPSGMPARPGMSGGSSMNTLVSIDGFGRPRGMGIGTTPDDTGEPPVAPAVPSEPAPDSDDLEIPMFEGPPPLMIPCSGCVELSAIVDDINQRSQFTFNAGGVMATRVVWTILLPFNSDQLFVRSIVNGSDGAYTFMSANVFPELNTPTELAQDVAGTINTVGLAFGSAGAWTGDQRISVFVDSVRFEGSNTTRTFDTGAEGFAAQGTERQPMVQFH
jgi:hypothetical protein